MRPQVRALLAASFALAAWGPAGASRLPDWTKSFVESAPALPEGVPKHGIRVLYRGVELEILEGGEGMHVRERVAIQVVSGRPENARLRSFPFDDTAKIKVARGWTLPPGSRASKAAQEPIEITVQDAFVTDLKERFVVTNDVGKGALVFFEFEADEIPHTMTWRSRLYEGAPIDRAVIEAKLPAGWDVKSAWLPTAGPAPERDGAIWRWTATLLEPAVEEPLGVEPWQVAPMLVLAFQPPRPDASKRPTFAGWDDVAAWYTRLAAGRTDLPEGLRADAIAALDAAGPDATARLHAAIRFVRDRIRYVAREVGIGGYQPHAASQTYKDRAGDCKDKATLLQAVVGRAGYTAYPFLVNATTPATVAPDVADPGAFNHMVLAVALPAGTKTPGESATIEAGDLGRLLIVDATDEYAPPGTLPVYLAGQTGLVVAGLHGRLAQLPVARPEDHAVATSLEAEIRANGSMAAHMTIVRRGRPAELARQNARESAADREAAVRNALRAAVPEATTGTYAVTQEDADGAFTESLAFDVPAPAAGRPIEPLLFFPRALADLPRTSLARRTGAVVYDYPRTLSYVTRVAGIAPGAAIPSGHQASGTGWSVDSSLARDGAASRAAWRLVLTRTRFAPEEFADLKQLWSAATKSASPLIPME